MLAETACCPHTLAPVARLFSPLPSATHLPRSWPTAHHPFVKLTVVHILRQQNCQAYLFTGVLPVAPQHASKAARVAVARAELQEAESRVSALRERLRQLEGG